MQCGPVRYKTTAAEQALKSGFDHVITPRFTRLRIAQKENENLGINDIYSAVVESEARNSMVINDVVAAFNENRYSIVLTERYEHALDLFTSLSKRVSNVFLLTGRGTVKEKREALEKIKQVSDRTPFVIVATGKYIGEGFDEPRLDTLFLAMPIAWQGTLAQYAGRLHRKCEGKTEVRIYDYVDIFVDVLERMYFKRLKGYAELGYRVKDFAENNTEPGIIFDRNSFSKVFSQDLQSVHHEAVIISPFLKKSRIIQITTMLAQARADGVKITVVTRCPEDYNEDEATPQTARAEMFKKYGKQGDTPASFARKYFLCAAFVAEGEKLDVNENNKIYFNITDERDIINIMSEVKGNGKLVTFISLPGRAEKFVPASEAFGTDVIYGKLTNILEDNVNTYIIERGPDVDVEGVTPMLEIYNEKTPQIRYVPGEDGERLGKRMTISSAEVTKVGTDKYIVKNFSDLLQTTDYQTSDKHVKELEEQNPDLKGANAQLTAILNKYDVYKNLYLETKEKKDKATCNFWPLVKQTAAYKFLYEYFAELYKNKIDENDYSNIISLKKQEKYYREKTETIL